MFVKTVTIDGFKSYAQRTEIEGFDPLFNAVTGLNGSGKSNILDAICFLLGITNLTQVRASNLQDLVYKNGQAGINKATVSITFDNSNVDQSPLGMESHNEITVTRQIVIGGRNKYLINGVNAQNSRVSDLFRSVGLNVNNPHFLIMQGRVTKVMNMKPMEILSMIEEATGTSMYEAKKESAQKVMRNKEAKLMQINGNLNEEIMPTLLQLRQERSSYLEYQKVQREIEQFSRVLIAYAYTSSENTASKADGEVESMNKEKEMIAKHHEEALVKVSEMNAELERLESERDLAESQSLRRLEEILGDKQKIEAKSQSNLNHQRDMINTEKKKLRSLDKSKAENETAIKNKEKEIEKMAAECEKILEKSKKDAEEYAVAQRQFQAVSAGFASSDDGQESTWQGQLMQTKRNISELQSDTKKAQLRLKHSKEEMKNKMNELKKTENAYKKDEAVLKEVEASYRKLNDEMNKLPYEDGKEEVLQFSGGKLLKKGELQRRCTIIPLDKVTHNTLSNEIIKRAKRLVGDESVHLALSLVGCDREVSKAVEFVFGRTLVAFDPKITTRTVTLDGDVFDPAGTVTGGSRPKGQPVLTMMMKMKGARDELLFFSSCVLWCLQVTDELNKIGEIAQRYRGLKHHLQMKEKECSMLKQRLQEGTHGQQLEEIDRLKTVIEDSEELLASSKDRENEMIAKCKELEQKIKNGPAEREKELKKTEKAMKDASAKADAAMAAADEKSCEFEALKLQKKELENEIKEYDLQMETTEKKIADMQKEYEGLSLVLEGCKSEVTEAKQQLQKQREYIQIRNQDIQKKVSERTDMQQRVNVLEHEAKEKDYLITKHVRESSEAANKLKTLMEEHDWIEHEKHLFGQSGSPYDYHTNNPKELSKRVAKLRDTKERLRQSVNMRAMHLLDKAEENCNDLLKKKQIIEKDKMKILHTINDLDQRKNEAVTKAYEQVNKDFGNIFSTLLPGATAKLSPPEGKTVLSGLEFRVGFGGVWKDNLSELSGGQRSLVALSLILAMLLLKPAPIYILDEVDAALDLSHTQNIGQMLKEHFKKSQFIVVSLKDGMFKNANVLFRTQFVDGVSTVTRYTQSNASTTSSAATGKNPNQSKDSSHRKRARI